MTTEICVMNKRGVALASDSAVTVRHQKGSKIYNSANKLFELPEGHAIGIMIYNSTDIMSVPWETLISIYKDEIINEKYNTVKEYVTKFNKFLSDNMKEYFPEKQQMDVFKSEISNLYMTEIVNSANYIIKQFIDTNGSIDVERAKSTIQRIIETVRGKFAKIERYTEEIEYSKLPSEYKKAITSVMLSIFGKMKLGRKHIRYLKEIACMLNSRKIVKSSSTGVVFAGFGIKQLFPEIISMMYTTVISDKLYYYNTQAHKIRYGNDAVIVPFAQSDMITRFVEGLDPDMYAMLESYTKTTISAGVIEALQRLRKSKGVKDAISEIQRYYDSISESSIELLRGVIRERYVGPLLQSVGILPISELAQLAETLVTLTGIKRRMTLGDEESVGGPTDLAIVTKGDGFLWLKRKMIHKVDNPRTVN